MGWVWSAGETFTDSNCPRYTGELAPVTLAEGYQQQHGNDGGPDVWEVNPWGYINRAGRTVAWHDESAAKEK